MRKQNGIKLIIILFLGVSCKPIDETNEFIYTNETFFVFDSISCLGFDLNNQEKIEVSQFFLTHGITASLLVDLCSKLEMDQCDLQDQLPADLIGKKQLLSLIESDSLMTSVFDRACMYPFLTIFSVRFIEKNEKGNTRIEFKNNGGGNRGVIGVYHLDVLLNQNGKIDLISCELDHIEI